MALDPVHFDGIARLARRIRADAGEADHRDLAETVWRNFLDPLWDRDGDRRVLEPLGELRRRSVDVQAAALADDRFATSHGLDSGTINPTTFKNGLVLDVAGAAMSACPTDLDLHRGRTIVMTAHTNDATRRMSTDWRVNDGGFCRQRVIQVPRVNRYEEAVVHALALYLAESRHALDNAGVVEDLLYLDGPLYPKGMLNWLDRDPELAQLLVDETLPREVLDNYVELVEEFVRRDVPVCGFVKNPGTKLLTRTLRERADAPAAPWVDDAALFRQILERRDDAGGTTGRSGDADPAAAEDDIEAATAAEDDTEAATPAEDRTRAATPAEDVRTDQLTFTNWFVSRGGTDRVMAADGDELAVGRDLEPAAYEVTFFVVFDPRDDVVYKVEAPYAVTRDPDVREDVTRQVLAEVAAERGPPLAVHKADELARIGREEKESLRRTLEREFAAERERTYDDVRWPLAER